MKCSEIFDRRRLDFIIFGRGRRKAQEGASATTIFGISAARAISSTTPELLFVEHLLHSCTATTKTFTLLTLAQLFTTDSRHLLVLAGFSHSPLSISLVSNINTDDADANELNRKVMNCLGDQRSKFKRDLMLFHWNSSFSGRLTS